MIADTEAAYLERIRTLFGNRLKRVDTHPGDWSEATLKKLMLTPPAVYVAWLGAGEPRTRNRMVSHWVFYVVGSMLNGRETNRIGLYQMVAVLLSGMTGFKTGSASPLAFEKATNLYSVAQGTSGVVLYALYFSCEEIIDPLTDISTLDDFLRHYETFGEPDGTPEFEAHINLSGAGAAESKPTSGSE
ncbi:phage protein Gp37 [Salmonella enterica]|uniref:phage protein Gp37 n=1 Tax=Salmonella enterica TaxID=28901 RepID=UPI003D2F02ED